MTQYQKRVRLKDFPYKGYYRYFITIVTDRKKSIFVNHKIVEQILKILKDSVTTSQFNLLVYCFIPDHLHILIEGKNEDSDMRVFVSKFKQKTGYKYKKYNHSKLWQENYYEHVLRNNEDSKKSSQIPSRKSYKKGISKECIRLSFSGLPGWKH